MRAGKAFKHRRKKKTFQQMLKVLIQLTEACKGLELLDECSILGALEK
jgi:hypothetical protein